MTLTSQQHDPRPQNVPLLRRRRAHPSLQQRAPFRLEPDLSRSRKHPYGES
jgi:hypothetical protein